MVDVTRKEILKIAEMSRISLSDEEIDHLIPEIKAILEYASSLQEVAEQAKKEGRIEHPSNASREDEAIAFDKEGLLAQAPERYKDYFVVPKILT
jgi:aspartyl-tRNA(Asn)/glutamyl-tRNA(Gln) amidotransferase subunit C